MEEKKDWKEQISGRKEEVQNFFGRGTKRKKNKGRGRTEEYEKGSRSMKIY